MYQMAQGAAKCSMLAFDVFDTSVQPPSTNALTTVGGSLTLSLSSPTHRHSQERQENRQMVLKNLPDFLSTYSSDKPQKTRHLRPTHHWQAHLRPAPKQLMNKSNASRMPAKTLNARPSNT
jgi:hypothetical protein